MQRCAGYNLDRSRCKIWLSSSSDCGRHTQKSFSVAEVHAPLAAYASAAPFQTGTVRQVKKPARTLFCCENHKGNSSGHTLQVTEGAAWIFDMDGTLVDVTEAAQRNNMHSPDRKERNFPGFMAEGQVSPPNRDIVRLAQDVHLSGGKVVVMTARKGWWGRASIWWLREHQVPYDGFYHRAEDDGRPDGETKNDLLRDAQRAGFEIEHAVDDNPPVVQVWCNNGIPTSVVPAERWKSQKNR